MTATGTDERFPAGTAQLAAAVSASLVALWALATPSSVEAATRVRSVTGEKRLDQAGSADDGFRGFGPQLAWNADSTLATVWIGPRRDETNEDGVRARKFDLTLNPLEDDFLVNAGPYVSDTLVHEPSIAFDGADDLLMGWEVSLSLESDVFARRITDNVGGWAGRVPGERDYSGSTERCSCSCWSGQHMAHGLAELAVRPPRFLSALPAI
jgi:hypothetical protein